MATISVPAIPISQLVNVTPGVIGSGAAPLPFNGLIVDGNLSSDGYPILPMGEVISFSSVADVQSTFGATSQEAGLASVYFNGPINATQLPSALLFAQYAINNVPALLLGAPVTSLSAVQAITNQTLSITINGTTVSGTLNLSSATSLSNAAYLIGAQLGITGIQLGTITASLSTTSPQLNVTAINQGPEQAVVTANLSGTTMTVTSVTSGYLAVGDIVTGTGIAANTKIIAYNGSGQPGGVGTYTLSASATMETGVTVTAYAPSFTLAVGQVVTGTGIPPNTYISAFGTGTGGVGTYVLSNTISTAETSETITVYAPGVTYRPTTTNFVVHSNTSGANSTISYASGPAAATLGLTQGAGAIASQGANASTPAAFMSSVVGQNWVSFMTTWEPTDSDKIAFATWNNGQNNSYVYEAWETDPLDTQTTGSALSNLLKQGNISGTDLIWTNPNITTLAGEKAAFQMGWTASIDFTQPRGVQTPAYKSYVGGLPDVTNATIAYNLAGSGSFYGNMANFYGRYSSFYVTGEATSDVFNVWQRGIISGPFQWKDAYVNQIWLNNSLQLAIMNGLANTGSVPYNLLGNAIIESWCADVINQAVSFGAITPGVQLSQAQQTQVNTQAGLNIAPALMNQGWYLQVLASTAPASVRQSRSSPSITLWYVYGGSVQSINISSIELE
jgi:hypothetical protein